MDRNLELFKWMIALVRPGTELATQGRLVEHLGVNAFVPFRTVTRSWQDRVVVRRQALMPGYVLVRVNVEERGQLVRTGVVARFLRFGEAVAFLTEEEISSLRRMSETDPNPEAWAHLEQGQMVRLLAGPFAGCTGEVVERHAQCYFTVRLPMLGRQIAVKMDLAPSEVSLLSSRDGQLRATALRE